MTAWSAFCKKRLANNMPVSLARYSALLITIPVLAVFFLSGNGGRFSLRDIVLAAPVPGQVETVTYPQRVFPLRLNTSQPRVAGKAAGAYDVASGYRLWERDAGKSLPIASLTKLMAALVFIDHNPGWQTRYTVLSADHRSGARDNLQAGDSVTIRELFRTALIASDNSAVISLVRASGLSEKDFVAAMNDKARAWHLKETTFADPTGLNTANRSTPGNLAHLAFAALTQADIREAVQRSAYSFKTEQGSEKNIRATDKLLDRPLPSGVSLIGGKTGHLDEAGFCFVGLFEKDGHQVVTVVLGTENDEARFSETEKLVEWSYGNFSWK